MPQNKISAAAAVAPNEVVYSATDSDGQYIFTGQYVNTTETQSTPASISFSDFKSVNTSRGTCAFDAATKTATLTKVKSQAIVMTYMVFTSNIVVPAMTEYEVTFSYDLTLTRKVSSAESTISSATEFFHFGNQDNSASATYHFNASYSGQYIVKYIRDIKSGATTRKTNEKGSLTAITYTNTTNAPITYTEYFGITCTGGLGTAYTGGTDVTLKMSDAVKITAINVPTVDKTQADYDANGNIFNFTFDHNRIDYTVSYTDVAGSVSDVTGAVKINTDGKCTLKDAGVYTFTFKIKDNCGAVWDSATNDQTDKTLTVTINHKTISAPSGTVETEYNGDKQSLSTLSTPPKWYDGTVFGDPLIIAMDDEFTDAGENKVTVTIISGGYFWDDYASNPTNTRTFNFNVTKKKLEVTFEENADSGLLEAKYDESQLFVRDKTGNNKPKLVTKYSKTGTLENAVDSPTGLGNWYAIAVLENADNCNYYTEAKQPFSATKTRVAYPKLSAVSDASQPYNNTVKTFEFTGYDSALMDFTVPDGATFDGTTLTAKNAGMYKIEYTLKDQSLYEWSGDTELAVTITPRGIAILADSGNSAEWGSGTATELTFKTAVISGDSVQLSAVFQRDGSAPSDIAIVNNGDGTHTVTIPASWGAGEYKLTVKVAEGENYTSDELEISFKITAEGLDLKDTDIIWLIDKKPCQAELDGDGYLLLEYTGTEISVEADIRAFVDFIIDSYSGDVSAKEAGEYSVSVRIVAADSTQYVFDKTFTLKYKIVPKVLDFSVAEWQWQYEGDGELWETMSEGNMPPYDGKVVNVRISPEYFADLGLDTDDYAVTYLPADNMTEKGEKTVKAVITLANGNFTTPDGESCEITKDWKITAKAVKYQWSTTQTVKAGDVSFELPAIEFEDGKDYSQYFEYYYTVDGKTGEYTKEELEAYLSENWSETTAVTGKVCVRMTGVSDDFVIRQGFRSFTTGASKTELKAEISGNAGEYGSIDFALSIKRGEADERARATVTVAGESFAATDTAGIADYINKLDAGTYTVTVSLTEENENGYMLTGDVEYTLTVNKFRITEEMWTNGRVNLPERFSGLDKSELEIIYKYYADENGTEEIDVTTLAAGEKYFANAVITGAKAGNFEFENGSITDGFPTSGIKEFEVPAQSSIMDYLPIILGIAAGLLLLLGLIIFLIARRRRADDDEDEYDYDDDEDDEEDYDDDY